MVSMFSRVSRKKHWIVWLMGSLLTVLLLATLSGCGDLSAGSSEGSGAGAKSYITKADYDQIQNGMTYDEVKAIIGSDGEQMSEVGTKGDALYTVVYNWKGKDGISNAVLEFQGDKLSAKSQVGLK